jgi:hypothetical protein
MVHRRWSIASKLLCLRTGIERLFVTDALRGGKAPIVVGGDSGEIV